MGNSKQLTRKILVLDQDEAYSKKITNEAKNLKLDVVICSELEDFTNMSKQNHFDLALVNYDLSLFEQGDVALCFENRPMVVMSEDVMVHDKQEHWPASVTGFVSKSASPKELLEAALKLIPAEDPKNQTVHFLLIDDDIAFAKIIQKTAKRFNIAISHAASLDELRNNRTLKGFDAVLLDYDLEETTGFAVAEILNTTAKDKPIIMVSSTNRPNQDRLNGLPNIIGFVSKWGAGHDFLSKTAELYKIQCSLKKIV